MSTKKIGIIGGGIMGMTLTRILMDKGYDVTIIEAAPEIGGFLRTLKFGDFSWDEFYHVILLSDLRTRNLLKELGLEPKIHWMQTKTGFFTDGLLYSMSDTIDFLKFPPLNLIDKFRLGITIIHAWWIKNGKRLEKIPVTTWLIRWSGEKTFLKIWLPLLRAKLGEGYKKTSAAFIWTTIQRLYGARKSGLKKEMLGYIEGGYNIVIKAIIKELTSIGAIIKTNHKVAEIYSGNSGKPIVKFTDNYSEEFDKIIVTLPSTIAADICKGLSDNEITKLKHIEYLSVICVSMLLNKPISPYYVTNITDSWIPFTGIIEMTSLVNKKAFGGYSLLYLPKYLNQDDPLMRAGDDEIINYFTTSLKKMYSWLTNNHISFVSVSRAKHVIALPTLSYSEKLPSVKTTIPGVYIINSSLITDGTLNVNETIKVAESRINEVLS
jgi:protoporphyrinogen oxidase